MSISFYFCSWCLLVGCCAVAPKRGETSTRARACTRTHARPHARVVLLPKTAQQRNTALKSLRRKGPSVARVAQQRRYRGATRHNQGGINVAFTKKSDARSRRTAGCQPSGCHRSAGRSTRRRRSLPIPPTAANSTGAVRRVRLGVLLGVAGPPGPLLWLRPDPVAADGGRRLGGRLAGRRGGVAGA